MMGMNPNELRLKEEVLRSVGADAGVGVYPGRYSFFAVPWAIHSRAFGPL